MSEQLLYFVSIVAILGVAFSLIANYFLNKLFKITKEIIEQQIKDISYFQKSIFLF